jgi:methionine aminopeptidase type I
MSIEIKTPEQIAVMREAGLVVARTLRVLAAAVRPGVTTAELDAIAEAEIRGAGATPSFKGYHGYPATICTSVNEEIVHGIPSPRRSLAAGDIISIDCGAIVGGWHGDAALTVGVGTISAADAALLEACETALWHGLARPAPGAASATSPMRWRPASADPAGTAWSRSTPATASAVRCTWTRRCPTTGERAAGRGCGRAWRWPSSRW